MASKSDALPMARVCGLMVAAMVAAMWLIDSLISWDFSVSAFGIRMLVVFSLVGAIFGYVSMKVSES